MEGKDGRQVRSSESVVDLGAGRQHDPFACGLPISKDGNPKIEMLVVATGDDFIARLRVQCPSTDLVTWRVDTPCVGRGSQIPICHATNSEGPDNKRPQHEKVFKRAWNVA
jgi:hypothetical protein